eukprot:6401946-Prymnesium_polylepis.1
MAVQKLQRCENQYFLRSRCTFWDTELTARVRRRPGRTQTGSHTAHERETNRNRNPCSPRSPPRGRPTPNGLSRLKPPERRNDPTSIRTRPTTVSVRAPGSRACAIRRRGPARACSLP